MNYSIDQYAYESKIKCWNAGVKIAFCVLLILVAIVWDKLLVSLIIIGLTAWITIGLGGLSIRKYLKMLRIPLVFLILGTIAIGVNIGPISDITSGVVKGDWYINIHLCYLFVTRTGFIRMLHIMLRALAAVSAMYTLSLSTPVYEIVGVLKKLHMPKIIIELMYLMYRYIFILVDTHRQMTIAAETRLGYRDYGTSFKTFGQINWNLLLISMKKASVYYDAMEARGYDGELGFLEEPILWKE